MLFKKQLLFICMHTMHSALHGIQTYIIYIYIYIYIYVCVYVCISIYKYT